MLVQMLLTPQCLHCASFSVQANLFCTICFQNIISPKIVKNYEFFEKNPHVFLIPWALSDPKSVDQLVYRLKNLQSELAMLNYVKKLTEILEKLSLKNSKNILIPIPSSRSKFNHAHSIAKTLSKDGFGLYSDILAKKQGDQQKYLSRSLRAKNRFYVKTDFEDFTRSLRLKIEEGHQVLFIDDILTTGESFKRCSELLGVAEKALCVTLFYREKA